MGVGGLLGLCLIGLSDSRHQWFAPKVMDIITNGTVFSGGKRHHEIMADMLPEGAVWIDITVPLKNVFREYEKYDDIVIFASGDPLFYGFANTLQREMPERKMKVFPSFNSLQMLAHRMCLPYHDMHVVSLTGRPWDKFDEALINGEQLIGVLTDRKKTPEVIMQHMHEYGYDNYTMTVGENLGNEEKERVYTLYPPYSHQSEHISTSPHLGGLGGYLSCLILQRTAVRPRPFGIPESKFALLDGRTKMITKMPIRLLSLSALDLRNRKTFWDIGFCTGSVSIEAKLQFPHLDITAFEIREEGRELMTENSRRFGTPGINAIIGDFLSQDISELPKPDAVFIGGHGGRLKEFIEKIHSVMNPGCCIVFNSVSEDSRQTFVEGIQEVGMTITDSTRIAVDEHNPIYILKAE